MLKAGIPVVIAMQYIINDATAILFSKNFYKALASGLSLDEAVAYRRRAIMKLKEDERDQDWGVPVLYTRYAKGDLFPELKVNEALHEKCKEYLYEDFPKKYKEKKRR